MSVEKVFGTLDGGIAEVLVSSDTTGGVFSIIVGVVPPGGGPPPHIHTLEDEFFFPLEGEFELFNGKGWFPLTGEGHYAPRNQIHAFRNCGSTVGRLMGISTGNNFDKFMPKLAGLQVPRDMAQVIALSAMHGITYVKPTHPVATLEAQEAELTLA